MNIWIDFDGSKRSSSVFVWRKEWFNFILILVKIDGVCGIIISRWSDNLFGFKNGVLEVGILYSIKYSDFLEIDPSLSISTLIIQKGRAFYEVEINITQANKSQNGTSQD